MGILCIGNPVEFLVINKLYVPVNDIYVHKLEDLNRKIYNCNFNVYFNKNHLRKNIFTNFAEMTIPNTSPD
jgi:hypothetical protein